MTGTVESWFTRREPPTPRSAWKRWLRLAEPEKAAAAVENMLADRADAPIWPAEISRIVTEYGLSGRQVRQLMCRLWEEAVRAAVADDTITDDESTRLAALRRVLQISEDEAMAVERKVIHPRFKRAVADVLADGHVSVEERKYLDVLSDGLRLSPTEIETMYKPAAVAVVQRTLSRSAKVF